MALSNASWVRGIRSRLSIISATSPDTSVLPDQVYEVGAAPSRGPGGDDAGCGPGGSLGEPESETTRVPEAVAYFLYVFQHIARNMRPVRAMATVPVTQRTVSMDATHSALDMTTSASRSLTVFHHRKADRTAPARNTLHVLTSSTVPGRLTILSSVLIRRRAIREP